ncbi:MAG: HlyD family efflux transporter periplasmic adaptor subunit [Planctomycetaceae bacterium]|nr:HlyD family efflux transporter periplasmic adaptor subunit [Planctomycetaceae bacterium]
MGGTVSGTYTRTKPKPLPVLNLVQSSLWAKRVAKTLWWCMMLSVVALVFLPWQQVSRTSGRVVAFVPQQRQQTVTAQVEGVVGRIAPGLIEGSTVKAGDFILSIEPLAAGLKQQLESQSEQLGFKLEYARKGVTAFQDQKKAFELARTYAVEAADQIVLGAENKLKAKQQEVAAYVAKELQAKLDLDRRTNLLERGLTSDKDFEKIRADYESASALRQAVDKDVEAARNEVTAKEKEREQKRLEAQIKVDDAEAKVQKALGELATIEKELLDIKIKQDELNRMSVTAPQDGTIFRLPVFEQGQQIKKGDELFTIVPDTTQHAVELYVSGNDLPLISVGAEVRLQFEGWPAVQFVGWPSIAIGSFGGVVAAIDATDNGLGEFRVLVRPTEEEPWPPGVYLRQGVRANGWVMLGQVPLWFELWRQLNGFPPTVSESVKPDDKPVKVPKVG